MTDELKPCPFCGHSASLRDDSDYATMDGDLPYWVDCDDCEASVEGFWTADDAMESWNKRAK